MKWTNVAGKRPLGLKGLSKADPNPILFNLNDADERAVDSSPVKKVTYQNPFTRVDPFSR